MITRHGCQEFIDLMNSVGWTPAETARRLKISEGSVSAYVNHKQSPPDSKLELLKHKIEESKSEPDVLKDEFEQPSLQQMKTDFLQMQVARIAQALPRFKPDEKMDALAELAGLIQEIQRRLDPPENDKSVT